MAMWNRVALIALWAMILGCGSSDVRDRPEDCDRNQYYHAGQQACRTCPAVVEPECMPGCGNEVIVDNRGCPILRCQSGCEGCEEGQQWDGEAQQCESA